MRGRRWMAVLVIGLAGMLLATGGCRKKRAVGGEEALGGTLGEGTGIEGSELSSRPGEIKYRTDVQLQAVLFDYDSTHIAESERPKLEAVADFLRRNSRAGVVVEGHCDERGSAEYNMALGERRALAGRAYLVGLGVSGDRIQTRSLGKEQPVATGHDEAAWRLNRRNEFVAFEH